MRTLHDATRDLHHACERHPVGQRMFRGEVSRQEWADWLEAFRVLHRVVDQHLPADMKREAALVSDLSVLPIAHRPEAAIAWAAELAQSPDRTGAAYVLHGAHCSGGAVLGPKMIKNKLPSSHILYADHEAVAAWIAGVKQRAGGAPQAVSTFRALLAVMDEIEARRAPPRGIFARWFGRRA